MGKIQWSTGVFCSGALIGPRHVATAKHCAPLNNPGVSVRFMPAYYDGESFPGAYVTNIIHLPGFSVNDPDADACDIKEDWAIFILDARLGDERGGLGAKVIEPSLINKPELLHLGYPGDLANGERPYRQERITIRDRFDCDATGGLSTDADVAGGMSGGPIVSNPRVFLSPLYHPLNLLPTKNTSRPAPNPMYLFIKLHTSGKINANSKLSSGKTLTAFATSSVF
ncbi:hypothetical protein K445DRAFT_314569 [Daldinia sp. EC12]|nr:hypothetical protein K445DRAFT_314569 [Daldinia sp. EC12]